MSTLLAVAALVEPSRVSLGLSARSAAVPDHVRRHMATFAGRTIPLMLATRAHQPLDAFAANANAVLDGEFGVDAWGAVDATVLAMGLEDPFDQLQVLFGARAGNVGGPHVVAGSADAE